MKLEKFDWNKANHSDVFDILELSSRDAPLELILHDASAQDTKKAYDAVVNHGLVSDFKVEVWNDIIGKLCEVANALDPNEFKKRFDNKRLVVSSPDRQKWIDYAHQNLPEIDSDEKLEAWLKETWKKCRPGELEASHFNNAVHDCLPEFYKEFPFVKSHTQLKGEYILELVRSINWWIDITPLQLLLERKVSFKLLTKENASIAEIMAIIISDLLGAYASYAKMRFINSARACIHDKSKLILANLLIVQLKSAPFSSVINFMTLKMKVNILDKWPIYFGLIDSFVQEGIVKLSTSSPLHFGFVDEYRYYCDINCVYSDVISFCAKMLSVNLSTLVNSDVSDSLDFSLLLKLNHDKSRITVTTKRPLPLSIVDEYSYSSRARVEHEGIETIEQQDEIVSFAENINIAGDKSLGLSHDKSIGIKENTIDLKNEKSYNLALEEVVALNHEEVLQTPANNPLLHKGVTGFSDSGEFYVSLPNYLIIKQKILKTSYFFELGFANEQSFKVKDGKLKTTGESITLNLSPQIDYVHEGVFDTKEAMLLEHSYGIGMEADVSFTSSSSSKLESNKTKELEGESSIKSTYLGELLVGLNAYLESVINGFATAYEASMYKYHIQGIEGVEQYIRTLDISNLSKVMDKVIAGQAITSTEIKAVLLSRLMRFLISNQNPSQILTLAEAVSAFPKLVTPKAIPVESDLDVFLDATYVAGDGQLIGDGSVGFDMDVEPVVLRPAESFSSLMKVEHETVVSLEETLSKRQEGTAISSSDSEASCTLARVSLTWAVDFEDELVSSKDNFKVSDVERTLSF